MSDAYISACAECCGGCGPNQVSPSICAENVKWFGCYPAGDYTVTICGGDFNHFTDYGTSTGDPPTDAWICPMYGVDDTPVVFINAYTTFSSQHAYMIIAGNTVVQFGTDSMGVGPGPTVVTITPAVQPAGVGFTTEAATQLSIAGCNVKFTHPGGPIGIHFNDNSFGNNCSSDSDCGAGNCGAEGKPRFGISPDLGVAYSFTAGTTCGRIDNDGTRNRYYVDFNFTSLCPYTGVTFSLDIAHPTDQILSPTTVTQDIAEGANTVTLVFDLRDETNKSFTARLTMSGGTNILGYANALDGVYLDYDLTPNIDIGTTTCSWNPAICTGYPQNADVYFNLISGLPCVREDLSCDLTVIVGGNPALGDDLAGYVNNSDCSVPPLIGDSGPWCNGVATDTGHIAFGFQTISFEPSSIALRFFPKVGTVDLPILLHTFTGLTWV